MTGQRVFDASSLPPYSISNSCPLWWGQLLMCAIEGSLLAILIATYLYLRLGVDVWPPPGVRTPSVVLPTIALVPLLASCIGSYLGSAAAKKNDKRGMLLGLVLNLVLALVFLILRAIEWNSLNFTWRSDAHGSIVWTILFLHTFDVLADVLMTTVLAIIIARGKYGPRQRVGVHVDSVLWYFLVGIWIPLYAVLYWGPYWIGVPR